MAVKINVKTRHVIRFRGGMFFTPGYIIVPEEKDLPILEANLKALGAIYEVIRDEQKPKKDESKQEKKPITEPKVEEPKKTTEKKTEETKQVSDNNKHKKRVGRPKKSE